MCKTYLHIRWTIWYISQCMSVSHDDAVTVSKTALLHQIWWQNRQAKPAQNYSTIWTLPANIQIDKSQQMAQIEFKKYLQVKSEWIAICCIVGFLSNLVTSQQKTYMCQSSPRSKKAKLAQTRSINWIALETFKTTRGHMKRALWETHF